MFVRLVVEGIKLILYCQRCCCVKLDNILKLNIVHTVFDVFQRIVAFLQIVWIPPSTIDKVLLVNAVNYIQIPKWIKTTSCDTSIIIHVVITIFSWRGYYRKPFWVIADRDHERRNYLLPVNVHFSNGTVLVFLVIQNSTGTIEAGIDNTRVSLFIHRFCFFPTCCLFPRPDYKRRILATDSEVCPSIVQIFATFLLLFFRQHFSWKCSFVWSLISVVKILSNKLKAITGFYIKFTDLRWRWKSTQLAE